MAYTFTIALADQVSRPLSRMASRFEATLSGMTRRASGLSGLMRPAMASVGRLGQSLSGLSRPHRIGIDTGEVVRAQREVDGLARSATRLDRHGRLRLANGRFAPMGSGGGAGQAGGGGIASALSMGGLVRAALPYVSAAAVGASALSFEQKAMTRERDEFSLGVMLKSPTLAKSMMGQFEAFAKKNPLLGMGEVTESGTRLVSLNERTDRVMPILSMMGDVAAGTKNQLSDLISVLGQVKSKGRLMAEENMQFQERRLNLNPYLSKVLGIKETKLADAMKDGQVGYEQVLRAINLMTAQGGIYHNMSERTGAETTYGKYQNLLESLDLQFTNLAVKTLPYVNKGLEAGVRLLDSMEGTLNGPLSESLLNAVDGVSTLGGDLLGFATNIGLVGSRADETGTLLQSLQSSLHTLGTLARGIGWVFDQLGKYGPVKDILKGTAKMTLNPLGGLFDSVNQSADGFFGVKPLKKEAPKTTPEERWVKANGLTALSADQQHERFQEAIWRRSQGEAFRALSAAEQHKRFQAARQRGSDSRTDLLGSSGLLKGEAITKKDKKGNRKGEGEGSAGGGASGVRGERPQTIHITMNVPTGIHLHTTGGVEQGLVELEQTILQTVTRAVASGARQGAS